MLDSMVAPPPAAEEPRRRVAGQGTLDKVVVRAERRGGTVEESEADVVVVGAGAVGSSTAYHLAKAGQKVTLVERGAIASGCSAAGNSNISMSMKESDHYIAFTLQAVKLYGDIEQELGADLEYERRGSISHVVEKESEWTDVLASVEGLNRVPGVDVQVLRTPEAQRLEPALPSWIQGVAFCPVNSRINPFKLIAAYVRAAKLHGAEVQLHTEVVGVSVTSGSVEAVVTSRGKIHSPWVVNAAGLGAVGIGRMVGVTIPVVPCHGQVAITAPIKPFLRYGGLRELWQLPRGNVRVGSTKSFVGPLETVRLELIPNPMRRAVRLFPFLRGVSVQRIWTGLRPWPVDGLPLLGPVAGVKGFLVAATHSGVINAEMIGHVIADLVVRGHTAVPIHPYRPDRFKGEQLSYVMKMYRDLHLSGAPTLRRGHA